MRNPGPLALTSLTSPWRITNQSNWWATLVFLIPFSYFGTTGSNLIEDLIKMGGGTDLAQYNLNRCLRCRRWRRSIGQRGRHNRENLLCPEDSCLSMLVWADPREEPISSYARSTQLWASLVWGAGKGLPFLDYSVDSLQNFNTHSYKIEKEVRLGNLR